MLDREHSVLELLGTKFELTAKKMANGEFRQRVKIGNQAISITKAGAGGWQNAHCHKGLCEYYLVLTGEVVVAEVDSYALLGVSFRRYSAGDVVKHLAGCSHNIALAPNSEFLTITTGEPVGNPYQNGRDWWPNDRLDRLSRTVDPRTVV